MLATKMVQVFTSSAALQWPHIESTKVVVLNLAKNIDRRKHMHHVVKLLGLDLQAEFFQGVDASMLGEQGLREQAKKLGVLTELSFEADPRHPGHPLNMRASTLGFLHVLLAFLDSEKSGSFIVPFLFYPMYEQVVFSGGFCWYWKTTLALLGKTRCRCWSFILPTYLLLPSFRTLFASSIRLWAITVPLGPCLASLSSNASVFPRISKWRHCSLQRFGRVPQPLFGQEKEVPAFTPPSPPHLIYSPLHSTFIPSVLITLSEALRFGHSAGSQPPHRWVLGNTFCFIRGHSRCDDRTPSPRTTTLEVQEC